MKIFFFSSVFYPSVGGIERTAEILSTQFIALGHEVRLATLTTSNKDDSQFPFEIIRRPKFSTFRALLGWCDVHIQANVSLKYIWPHFLSKKPIVYRHGNAYQCDDGRLSQTDRLKRSVARRTHGIANSRYTAQKLGCAHTVLNPFDDAIFTSTQLWADRSSDLVFLGRLVSQKGCDILLEAVGKLAAEGIRPKLTIIGEGPDRLELEDLGRHLGVAKQLRFAGVLKGRALADELNKHQFFIAPSRYEEPFGIVALEALACGCFPIVSERGGLVDAIGQHGATFPNGDHAALAEQIKKGLNAPQQARARLREVQNHLRKFSAPVVAEKYLEILDYARRTASADRRG